MKKLLILFMVLTMAFCLNAADKVVADPAVDTKDTVEDPALNEFVTEEEAPKPDLNKIKSDVETTVGDKYDYSGRIYWQIGGGILGAALLGGASYWKFQENMKKEPALYIGITVGLGVLGGWLGEELGGMLYDMGKEKKTEASK